MFLFPLSGCQAEEEGNQEDRQQGGRNDAAQHPRAYGALRARRRPVGEGQRNHPGAERQGGHQDGPQAQFGGGNGSFHAFVATAILPGCRGVVGLTSRRIDPKGTDTAFLADRFLRFAEDVFAAFGEIHAVFADSAEQVLIGSLRSALLASRFSCLAGLVYNSK